MKKETKRKTSKRKTVSESLALMPHGPYKLFYPSRESFAPYVVYLKAKGLADTTIRSKLYMVKRLSKSVNLNDPQSVVAFISNLKCGFGKKRNYYYAYADYCELNGIKWQKPRLPREKQKIPYIPLEKDIDQLISGFTPKYSPLLLLLKETGMRIGEALRIKATDIDFEHNIITLNIPEKGSNPRQFKVSSRLIATLKRLVKDKGLIWKAKPETVQKSYIRTRKRLAKQLANPNLLRITLHSFRHWKATMEYHKTKDILYVKQLLGHKSIENTLIYTHLVNWESDEYMCKVANNIEEAKQLIESGFEYVTDYGDKKLFRKRK